jgi:hypothetical protein
MFYLKAFISSLYNIEWLGAQKKQTAKGFAYVVLLMLVLSGAYSLYLVREIPNVITEGVTYLKTEVPDMSATVTDGSLTIDGVEQPYIFEGDDFLLYLDAREDSVVVLEDVVDLDTKDALVLTNRTFMVHQQGSKTETHYIKDLPNFTFTKADVIGLGEKVALGLPAFVFFLLWFVLFLGFGIWKIIQLLFVSFLAWGVSKIAKKKWLFEEIYTVGLFAITLPTILLFILSTFFDVQIPYAHTLLVLAILSVVILQKPKHHDPLDTLKDAWKK